MSLLPALPRRCRRRPSLRGVRALAAASGLAALAAAAPSAALPSPAEAGKAGVRAGPAGCPDPSVAEPAIPPAAPASHAEHRTALHELVRQAVERSSQVGAAQLVAEAAVEEIELARSAKDVRAQAGGAVGPGLGRAAGTATNDTAALRWHASLRAGKLLWDGGRVDRLTEWRLHLAESARHSHRAAREDLTLSAVSLALERSRLRQQAVVYGQTLRRLACLLPLRDDAAPATPARPSPAAAPAAPARPSPAAAAAAPARPPPAAVPALARAGAAAPPAVPPLPAAPAAAAEGDAALAQRWLQQVQVALAQTQSQARQVELRLRRLAGDGLPLTDGVATVLVAVPALEEALRDAERSSELAVFDAQASALGRYAQAVAAGARPEVRFSLDGDGAHPLAGMADPAGRTRSGSFALGVSVSVPVRAPGLDAALDAARQRARAAELLRQDALEERRLRVAEVHEQTLAAFDRASRAAEVLRNSDELRRATFHRWRHGVDTGLFDLVTAEAEHLSLRLLHVDALHEGQRSNAALLSMGRGLFEWLR